MILVKDFWDYTIFLPLWVQISKRYTDIKKGYNFSLKKILNCSCHFLASKQTNKQKNQLETDWIWLYFSLPCTNCPPKDPLQRCSVCSQMLSLYTAVMSYGIIKISVTGSALLIENWVTCHSPAWAWVQVLRGGRGIHAKKWVVRPPDEFYTCGQPWIATAVFIYT